jgi:hypothetical protein
MTMGSVSRHVSVSLNTGDRRTKSEATSMVRCCRFPANMEACDGGQNK